MEQDMSQELSNRDVRRKFRMRKNASTRIDFLKIYMEIFQLWHWNDPPLCIKHEGRKQY